MKNKQDQINNQKSTDSQKIDNKLMQEITNLKTEIAELKNGWQRTQADFDNFRKRTQIEKAELIKFAGGDLIVQLLPVLDNFNRALAHKPKELTNNEYVKGLEYIKIQLEQALKSQGLEIIDVKIGDVFNPQIHEAISTFENPKFKTDQIINIVENGYLYNDKVIRPAKVQVAK